MCDGKKAALGTVVGADGWVLTKASQLDDKPVCQLKDGTELEAEVVGKNDRYDLALLKIEAKGLKPVKWADSQAAPVGNWVASPGMGRDPVAIGVVSVAARLIPRDQYLAEGKGPRGGFLGVGLETAEDEGVRISHVVPGSAAAKAGLKVNDIILTLAGKAVTSEAALVSALRKFKPGDIVRIRAKRGDQEMKFRVKLSKRPGMEQAEFQNRLGSELSGRRKGFPIILQHDSVLKPTDCGGPLVDLEGRAIGINISRAGRTESYAIPAEALPPLLHELSGGKLARATAKK
jgi:serine protease Do